MTFEGFINRLSASLALGGGLFLVVAVICWMSGGGNEAVRSIHNVGGSMLACFGVVMLGAGFAFAAMPATRTEAADNSSTA